MGVSKAKRIEDAETSTTTYQRGERFSWPSRTELRERAESFSSAATG